MHSRTCYSPGLSSLSIFQVGEQLCRLELEKQEAAKAENYEEAMEKKEKIELIRQELARNVDLDSLLSASSRPHHYSRPVIVSHQKLCEYGFLLCHVACPLKLKHVSLTRCWDTPKP